MLKGIRCETAKCAMERQGRSNPPGMHAWRRGKASPYAIRLREKQKVKRYYGVFESEFLRYFTQAERLRQNTGMALLCLLERRLDNVLYKSGMAPSRRSARQVIIHGHVHVNGRRVDRPGYRVDQGDKLSIKGTDRSQKLVRQHLEGDGVRTAQPWLQVTPERLEAVVVALPTRDDVQIPVEEQLIVELCSR
jgi:small subunit ribosomal protein S4